MSRAHLSVLLTDSDGDIQPSTALEIAQTDGSPLGVPVYDAQVGGASILAPATDSGGRFDGYVDVPVRVRVTPSGGTARIEEFHPDPVDVVVQSNTTPVILDGYDGTSAVLELHPEDDVRAYALRVRDDDGSDIVRVRKSAGGRNLVLVGDDGTLPEASLLHATQSLTASQQNVVNITAFVGIAGIVGVSALNVTATHSIAGGSNFTAAKILAVRGPAAATGEAVALRAWLSNANAGGTTPKLEVGVWASSIGAQSGATAFLADGSGGWTDLFRGYNAADTLVAQITAGGTATFTSILATSGMGTVTISVSGTVLSTAASTAAGPTLYFTAGAGGVAGLYSPSADVLGLGTNSTERLRILANGNLGYHTTDQFGSGVGVIGIANAGTAPTTNPTGGGVLYVSAGALRFRGSSGTVTVIAPA